MNFTEEKITEENELDEKRRSIILRHQKWRKDFLQDISADLPKELRP